MYNNVGLLQTEVIMFINLQKCHHIFSNISFLFNRHYIDDVEVFFSTSADQLDILICDRKSQNTKHDQQSNHGPRNAEHIADS